MRIATIALSLSFVIGGCAVEGSGPGPDDEGGDDGSGGGDDEGGGDDGGDDGGDMPAVECPQAAMGTVAGLTQPEAYQSGEDFGFYAFVDETTGFSVELYSGWGVFTTTPPAPGTFEITGPEADPIDCGVCTWLYIDRGTVGFLYLATAGTVTVEATAGTFRGTASGLVYTQVDEDSFELVGAGACSGAIDSVSFEAPVTIQE